MAELTNLTDRISHLRDRKGSSSVVHGGDREPARPPVLKQATKKSPERRFSGDYFMVFAYTLLSIALLTQFVLIAWLDVV